MKIKHLILSALAVASIAVSCKKDNEQNSDKPSLTLNPAELSFEVAGGTQTVSVEANRDWSISDPDKIASWLTVEKKSDTEVEVTAAKNDGKDRTAEVTLRIVGVKKSISISQKGEGGAVKPVGEGDGTKEKPYNVAQALKLAESLASGAFSDAAVYVAGTVVSFKDPESTVSKYGSLTIYISDDGTTNNQFYVYALKGVNGAKFTVTNPFNVGDQVVLYGYLQNYMGNTPEMTRTSDGVAPQLVSVNGSEPSTPEPTPDPTPDPTPSDAIFSETFSASQGAFTIEDKVLPEGATYVWTWTEQYGMKASAFINSQSLASESWLISPEIDLTSVKEASLSFDHAANKFPSGKKVTDFVSVKVSKDGSTWANLTIPTWPEGTSWTFIASGNADLTAYAGSKIKIAFVYTSADGESGTWELKNVVVFPKAGSSEPVVPTPDPDEPVVEGGISVSVDKAYLAANKVGTMDDVISYENSSDYGQTAVTELRVYKGQSLTVTAKSGYTICSVTFTCTAGNNAKQGFYTEAPITVDAGATTESTGKGNDGTITVTGNTTKVVYTAEQNQMRVTKMTVVYKKVE